MLHAFQSRSVFSICWLAVLLSGGPVLLGQQVTDTNFNVSVAKPAFTSKHPRVWIDEAHFNVHTLGGGYKPFADLVKNDGCQVTANNRKFDAQSLAGCDVLVIANARAEARPSEKPAFTDAECDAVRDWVRGGGALLFVTDHHPIGHAGEILAKRFAVDMSKGTATDRAHSAPGGGPSQLLYTREAGLLGEHAITRGRDESERLNKIITFTGQSLKGPDGSVAFLKLSDTATDRPAPASTPGVPDGRQKGARRTQAAAASGAETSAAGRTQGLAFTFGKGRVVILGEASQLSAQRVGPQQRPMGMNYPGTDNRQMALNIVRWLSRLMD